MAIGGFELGSASFGFTAENQDLIVKGAQAEAAAKKNYEAIAQAAGVSAASVERSAKQLASAYQAESDASAAATLKIIRADNDAAASAQKAADARAAATLKVIRSFNDQAAASDAAAQKTAAAGSGFDVSTKAALGFAGALVGVQASASGLHAVLADAADQTLKLADAEFTLSKRYGDAAPVYEQLAKDLATANGQNVADTEKAVASFDAYSRALGLTSDQVFALTKRSADLAAANGTTNVDAAHALEQALRGDGDAAAQLGAVIDEKTLKAYAGLTDEQAKHFDQLGPIARAQAAYNVIMAETAAQAGSAADKTQSAAGQIETLGTKVSNAEASIGKVLLPTLGKLSDQLGDVAVQADKAATEIQKIPPLQQGINAGLEGFGLEFAAQVLGPLGDAIKLWVEFNRARQAAQDAAFPVLGPAVPAGVDQDQANAANAARDAQVRARQAAEDEKARQQAIIEVRKQARDTEAQTQIAAAQAEHDRDVAALTDKKALLAQEEADRLKGIDTIKQATLANIREQAEIAKQQSDATIAQYRVDEAAALQSAKTKHDDAVAGIDAETKATADAVTENVRQLTIQRDRATQANEDRKTSTLRTIADEQSAYEKQSAQRTAQIEKDKQTETQAASDKKDADLRSLDEREKASEKYWDGEIARATQTRDKEKQDASDQKDADLKYLDQRAAAYETARTLEDRQRQAAEQAELKSIDDRQQALSDARAIEDRQRQDAETILERSLASQHDVAVKGFDAEKDAADAADKAILVGLDARETKAGEVRDAALADIQAETQATKDAADQQVRDIEATLAAAQKRHDDEIASIKAESDAEDDLHRRNSSAEDDRHRTALANITSESQAKQDAIDAQIRGLDDLDKAAQNASTIQGLNDRVASAQTGVLKAQSSGNQSEIDAAKRTLLEAQQALVDGQLKIQHDGDRQRLQDQKDALTAQTKQATDAENDRDRVAQAAEAERDRLEKDRLSKAGDAAAAELKIAQDTATGEKAAVQDALTAAEKVFSQRTIDVRATYDAEVVAIGLAKAAEQTSHDATLVDIGKRKDAEADAYDATVQKAKDAYKAQTDIIADRRVVEDRALDAEADKVKDTYQQESDRLADLRRIQDEALAKQKLAVGDAYDAEIRKVGETYDDPVKGVLAKLHQQASDAKEQYALRKQRVSDSYDAEVRKIHDTYDDPVSGLLAKQRQAADDAKTSYELRRQHAQDSYDDEQRRIHATYDAQDTGVIPALQRSLDAYRETASQRKTAVDLDYQHQQDQIHATYEDPQKGLIITAQRAADAVAKNFRDQATDVEASAQAQRASIENAYHNPGKTGVLDQIDDQINHLNKSLDDTKAFWDKWKEDIWGPNGAGTKAFEQAKAQFDRILGPILGPAVPPVPPVPSPGIGGGSGGGTAPPSGSNAIENQDAGVVGQIGGRPVELGTVPGSVAPQVVYQNVPEDKVRDLITAAFTQYISPEAAQDALQVWAGEGKGGYVGDHGTSFGPFQLHVGGGLADQFANAYNEDVRDPNTWQDQVLFAASYVKAYGWNGQWHGAPADIANKHYADGGWLNEPIYGIGASGQRYWFAENAPERVLSPSESRAYDASQYMPAQLTMPEMPRLPSLAGALPSLAASGAGASNVRERQAINFTLGGHVLGHVVVSGLKLEVERGLTLDELFPS